jgi:uncharacterized protein YyaL (SSP411 family)
MPSFRKVLAAVTEAWRTRRDEVERQADALAAAIARRTTLAMTESGPVETSSSSLQIGARSNRAGTDLAKIGYRFLALAVDQLSARFDSTWGGFGPAPKFPQPTLIELCLRHHRLTGAERSLTMATTTLRAMAWGGIYDHVGGGFARYSTDRIWTVPHFEKMLYDQAGLVRVYLHAWQVTGAAEWHQVVAETVDYVLRDLASSGGGFCSSEDADAEGEEGRFSVWTPAEIAEAVGPELAAETTTWFGVTKEGNFEGNTILRRPLDGELTRPPQIELARERLQAFRDRRVRPGRDDKVLTEWNAMFASALAEAAASMARQDWADAAVGCGQFLWSELRNSDGRWLRSWQGGRARHLAYAADYAWLVDAFTRLAELTGTTLWLERAEATADDMVRLFRDGGSLLYTTGTDAEPLVVRPMDLLDGATPSANSVAATAMIRLGQLCERHDLVDVGEGLLRTLATLAGDQPLAMANIVAGSSQSGTAPIEVVITGERADLVGAFRRRYEPNAVLAWGERSASPLWANRPDGFAYVCRQFACKAPVATDEDLDTTLEGERASDATTFIQSNAERSAGSAAT